MIIPRKFKTLINKLDKNKRMLIISFTIIIIAFLLTRLPFFLYYPVPNIANDTPKYYKHITAIHQGEWPEFTNITPGYPLLIELIFLFSDKLLSIILVQNIITLLSSLLIVYSIYKLSPLLSCFSAVAVAVFISNGYHTFTDCTYRVDGVYVNFIIISFALLILATRLKRPIFFILCSCAMAFTIYLRPTGTFFIVIYVLIIIYLFRNHYSKKNIFCFSGPFAFLLLGLCVYNYFTIKAFVISPFGERNLIQLTLIFVEPDPSYPPEINGAIKKFQEGIPARDRDIIFNSWNLKRYQQVLLRHWARSRSMIVNSIQGYKKWGFMEQRPFIRRLAMNAIRKHPGVYLKCVLSNLYFYFFEAINIKRSFYPDLNNSYNKLFVTKDYTSLLKRLPENSRKDLLKEFYNPEPLPYFKLDKGDGKPGVTYVRTNLQIIHHSLSTVQAILFKNVFWSIGYFFSLCLSLIVLVRSGFRHNEAFIIFLMNLAVLGAALIVCLVQRPFLRYTYVMEFVYYLGLTLLPLLKRPINSKEQTWETVKTN